MFLAAVILIAVAVLFLLTTLALSATGGLRGSLRVTASLAAMLAAGIALILLE